MATPSPVECLSGSVRRCSVWMRETLKAATRALREQSAALTKGTEEERERILAHEHANWITACHFAGHKIDPQRLIYASQYSFCVLTPRPVVRGHGIVCPRKPVEALFDLTEEEADDLFLAVQLVSWILTNYCGCTATTVTLQQGEAAHQTLPQLFVHVVPRKADDFPCNDYIYELLAEAVPNFGIIKKTRTEAVNTQDHTPRRGTTSLAERKANCIKAAPLTPQSGPTAHAGHHTASRVDSRDISALPLDEIEQQSREIRTWLLNLRLDELVPSPCADDSQATQDVEQHPSSQRAATLPEHED